jgi:thioredoxin 1
MWTRFKKFLGYEVNEPPKFAAAIAKKVEAEKRRGSLTGKAPGLRNRKGHPSGVHVLESDDDWVDALADSVLGGRPVIVKFTATWCKPCQTIAPVFKLLANNPSAKFVEVDIDKLAAVAADAGVTTVPQFQVWNGDAKGEVLVGADEAALKGLIGALKTAPAPMSMEETAAAATRAVLTSPVSAVSLKPNEHKSEHRHVGKHQVADL